MWGLLRRPGWAHRRRSRETWVAGRGRRAASWWTSVHALDVAEQFVLNLSWAVPLADEEVHVTPAGGVAPAVALGEGPLAVVADDREQRAGDRVGGAAGGQRRPQVNDD